MKKISLVALVLASAFGAADAVSAKSVALPNSDVPPTNAGAVSQQDVASGKSVLPNDSGNFCPDGAVTRQEVAKFIVRALGLYWLDGNIHIIPF